MVLEWGSADRGEAKKEIFKFMIPFILSMFCIGFPVTFLELALGQYTQASAVAIFDLIAPISVGVGISATILQLVTVVTHNNMFSLMMSILVNSIDIFGSGLFWDNCVGYFNEPSRSSRNAPKCSEMFCRNTCQVRLQ
ncbi:unnamed protein product [Heligmosomoides polygyrus]|uniref:Multidrug resistance protein, MATE family n=1 Tax=Heligmosomoides polygyrus TaxID=6339 RepID=A0A183GRU8_HELPZ|nr:unnamed protein product [Heligmosomoides polygyrus]